MALKLTDSDKKTIVELYQHPEESTATLASRYAVSSSTISRILKQELSPTEYKNLVQRKKGGGSKPQSRKTSPTSDKSSTASSSQSSRPPAPKPKLKSTVVSTEADESSEPQDSTAKKSPSKRNRTRQRSSAKAKAKPISAALESGVTTPDSDVQLTMDVIPTPQEQEEAEPNLQPSNSPSELSPLDAELDSPPDELVQEIQSDLLGENFDDDLDDLDDDDLDDLDDNDVGEEDLEDANLELPLDGVQLSILPFSEAKLPRTCYLIIDRSAELITRPLKTFADLGTVPEEEINEPTLPIFDNHRVAKRFANRRTQRIVKVPDARVLRKTSPYLMDKGITRLLLDGQVYALMDEEEDELE